MRGESKRRASSRAAPWVPSSSSNGERRMRRAVTSAVLTAALVAVLAGASSAQAQSPWWHLTSGSRPLNLQSGAARSEVQEIAAAPGELFGFKGAAFEVKVNEKTAGTFATEQLAEVFELPEPTPENVQKALEGEEYYGRGNVTVTGGPVGTAPLVVTSVNEDADLSVPEIEVVALVGTAKATVVTSGHPDGQIVATVANLGDGNADGTKVPVTIHDMLPAGLRPVAVEGIAGAPANGDDPGAVECAHESRFVTCTFGGSLPPYDQIEVRVGVVVEADAASSEDNAVSVSGGEAPDASLERPLVFSRSPTPFGVDEYRLSLEEEGGTNDTQAGSHPFQMTTTLALNQITGAIASEAHPAALAKDLNLKLPPGLIGNPTPLPRCATVQFLKEACSPQSAVGVAMVTVNEPLAYNGVVTFTVAVFNLEPEFGEPARFGFLLPITPVYIDTSVRSGDDYGVTASVSDISETAGFLSSEVTFWGVPGDARHDNARGYGCLGDARGAHKPCSPLEAYAPPPFLVLPTSCPREPLLTEVEADSWLEPRYTRSFKGDAMQPLDGCNKLPFDPELKVAPDVTTASTPTGLNVDVHVPQDAVLVAGGLAESDVKDIAVTLPEGVVLNPSGTDGLQTCTEELIGFEGFRELNTEPGAEGATFTSDLPEPLEPGVNYCPDASKIGTVDISSPLLPPDQHVRGFVYLASQNDNPFGSLIALYLVGSDPISGFVFKAVGETRLTHSGQLTTTFDDTPQLAFEDADLHFFGGERAPLASPARCGTYTSSASLTPWSAEPDERPRVSSSTFGIASGPNGSPCPGVTLPFSPSLHASSSSIQAGAFSPFRATISREDGQQNMQSVELHMPAGFEGLLSGVKLCSEQQANEGTCGEESLIGGAIVSAGVGNDPVTVTGGRVYITEKYAGAPFGLSIVSSVKAGPFDLEHDTSNPSQQPLCDCVVVRAKIAVDPTTAALTIATDSVGPHSIPQIVDGVPVQIRKVNVTIDRPGFTFNPTNCSPLAVHATIASDEGAASAVSVPFQVANCATLGFKPDLKVSTSAHTSRADGARLSVRLAYPHAPFGSQANISMVKVDLPKQLPSRLTTLQRACSASTFWANPAACPTASVVGRAKATTPVLPVPLEGPVYFVSHGGEAFPSLIMVLQGYGVTVDMVGTTFISRAGVTSTTFKRVPDVPIRSFELSLPQGRFSAVTANANLCRTHLRMPTVFVAQSGIVIRQRTKIAVAGCHRHTDRRAIKAPRHLKRKHPRHIKRKHAR